MDIVSQMIRSDISVYDDALESRDRAADGEDEAVFENPSTSGDPGIDNNAIPVSNSEPRVVHGSAKKNVTFAELEASHADDEAFHDFRTKLTNTLASQLQIGQVCLCTDDVVRV